MIHRLFRKEPPACLPNSIFWGSPDGFYVGAVHGRLGTSRPGVMPFDFAVPLDRFEPGDYIAQITIIDEVGGKSAFLRNAIHVLR